MTTRTPRPRCLLVALILALLLTYPAPPITHSQDPPALELQMTLGYGAANDLAWSPDGSRLAVLSNRSLDLYDADLNPLPVHYAVEDTVFGWSRVAWSFDGAYLVVSTSNAAQVVDGQTLEWVWTLPIGGDIYWRPLDHQLAAVTSNATVVWDIPSRQQVATLDHEWRQWGYTSARQWSPDGTVFADANVESLLIWDVERNTTATYAQPYPTTALTWNPDGTHIALGQPYDVIIVEATTGAVAQQLARPEPIWGDVREGLHWTEVGLTEWSTDVAAIVVWSLDAAQEATLQPLDYTIFIAAVKPDDRQAAVITLNQDLLLVDAMNWSVQKTYWHYANSATGVSWSPDDSQLVSADRTSRLMWWDAMTGQHVDTLVSEHGDLFGVAFSPDGTYLATYWHDIAVWDTMSHVRLWYQGHPVVGSVRDMAWSSDGTYLAAASEHDILVWKQDARDAYTLHQTLNSGRGYVDRLAWSPDDYWLATCEEGLRVWEVATGDAQLLVEAAPCVNSLAWDATGQRLVVATNDKPNRIAAARDDDYLTVLDVHTGAMVGEVAVGSGVVYLTRRPLTNIFIVVTTRAWYWFDLDAMALQPFVTPIEASKGYSHPSQMVWNHAGTRLAVIGLSDQLQIWAVAE